MAMLRYWFIALLAALLGSACSPYDTRLDSPAPPLLEVEIDLERYRGVEIGEPFEGRPWIAHVRAVDLDRDGRMDIIGCEAKRDEVIWLRQGAAGEFEEVVLADEMQGPVHAEVYDLDGDGDLDILVSCMNIVFPNNDKIGALIVLENDGAQKFSRRILLEGVDRVTDAKAADMDGDGDLDLVVGQFGYDQGQVRWMRNTGLWTYESEVLLYLSGTINVCIDDFDGDGHPDIAALLSQQWEEIHLFSNDGKGKFTGSIVWGSTNQGYASSGMTNADLNQDGRPDLVFTNGDGFGPTAKPGPRPWHGVQLLENRGQGKFEYKRLGNLGGAYAPVVRDIDGDGDLDVLCLSSFNDWNNPKAESLVWFRQDEAGAFTKVILAHQPKQLLTIDVASFSSDGSLGFVTGGFYSHPPFEEMSRFMFWSERKTAGQ